MASTASASHTTVELIGHRTNKNMFIVIDGKKYKADEKGEAIKDDKGQLIPYVEEGDDKGKKNDTSIADKSVEDIAKENPAIAKMLADKAEADRKLAEQAQAEEERKRKEAEQKGEWQKLAEEEKAKREDAERKLKEKDETLGKYVTSTENVVKGLLKDIPEEKQKLIPKDYSVRQKLEYITENADVLGAKISNFVKGDKVDKNDADPSGTELAKLTDEFNELRKKGDTRTPSETARFMELGTKINELRNKK